jgi:CRP/FNR family transcriptional regulator
MKKNDFSGCSVSLNTCNCLSKLTSEELQFVDSKSVMVQYKKGELICKQGALASHILFVQEGLVKVFLENGKNSLVLKIIPSDNLLGLSWAGKEISTFQYSAIAYVDSFVKQIDINAFREVLDKNIEFAKSVIETLGANSAQINGRFFCLTHKQSYGRLADILLCLSERVFKNSDFELPLMRKELAELCGMTAETVIRMLKKFKDDGIIENTDNYFKIVDFQRLRNISENG